VTNACNILDANPEGKRPFGRHRHMWEDNVKMAAREISMNSIVWVYLAHVLYWWQAFVNTIKNL
jgi:hypothetical protein